jgi:hypothetical protein
MAYPFDYKKHEEYSAYDPNKFDSFIVKPEKLDDQILFSLVDLFNNNVSSIDNDSTKIADLGGPNTQDKILSALAVGYITLDGIVVAGCVLQDPTILDYHGSIPSDHYEMLTGISLENRIEQEYFVIHPDYHDVGLATELRRLIKTVVENTFIVILDSDVDAMTGLQNAGYQLVSTFMDVDTDKYSQLWLS